MDLNCGCCSSALNKRVHCGEKVEGPLLQHLDELPDVARVGNQGQVRAPADRQQAEGQREDVIQRQRGDAIGLADVADAFERRA